MLLRPHPRAARVLRRTAGARSGCGRRTRNRGHEGESARAERLAEGQGRERRDERDRDGFRGRFGAGLPPINDGSFLFLQHMISKMKPAEQGGSRLAIVFNGSPLFTGAAGSGPSEIRRWIIENDWLEAVVALPDQLFYNTASRPTSGSSPTVSEPSAATTPIRTEALAAAAKRRSSRSQRSDSNTQPQNYIRLGRSCYPAPLRSASRRSWRGRWQPARTSRPGHAGRDCGHAFFFCAFVQCEGNCLADSPLAQRTRPSTCRTSRRFVSPFRRWTSRTGSWMSCGSSLGGRIRRSTQWKGRSISSASGA
jgi:N-6 DNA methylase